MIVRAHLRLKPLFCVAISMLLLSGLTTGCASQPVVEVWPQIDVLPKAPPKDLDLSAQANVIKRGSDGFFYLVGTLGAEAKVGQSFLARYSGEWPLEDVPRPPLARGKLLRVYKGNKAALVQLEYNFPDVELDRLEVTWQERAQTKKAEDVGKGVGKVINLKPDARSDIELNVGKNVGVQPGDLYGIFKADGAKDPTHSGLQLGRRLSGICLINAVTEDKATCRMWRGSGLHPSLPEHKIADEAIFLEHTFGAPPRQGLIQLATISGDDRGQLRKHLIEQFNKYLTTHATPNITVEELALEANPQDPDFHRVERQVKSKDLPQLLVAGALKEVDGELHLIINYTGIGGATGPGMVAAPPERGIDLGPPGDLDGKKLRHVYGLIYSAMLVYRGQTSEAMTHLRQFLAHEEMAGPLRWHARDQYAMRWAALGYAEEALWLVLEDEAVAKRDKNMRAELNALGTRVRLYDMVKQHSEALAQARRYLKLRQDNKGKDGLLAAQGMLAEMILSNKGELTEVKTIVDEMIKSCPEGCQGDLFSMLSGIYWSLGEGQEAYQEALLEQLEELARKDEPNTTSPLATTWIYQGIQQMREREYEQAIIAFLEAERLFKQQSSGAGLMRTQYFTFLCQMALKDPIKAYETASAQLELATAHRDWQAAKNVYDRLSGIYAELDPDKAPGAYLRIVSRILTSVFEAQLADGQMGKASETLFAIGNFFFRSGALKESTVVFQKSIIYAIRSTRFDVAALGHLTLGLISRAQGDQEDFRDEIERAKKMAKIAKDPQVDEAIRRALEPPTIEEQDPVDTKLL